MVKQYFNELKHVYSKNYECKTCLAQVRATPSSNPPLIPPPILNLGERNTENCSNQTLIWFLTLGELSSGARDLLHLGALLRTLIRARRATTGLPAPPGTSPRLPLHRSRSGRASQPDLRQKHGERERASRCAPPPLSAPHTEVDEGPEEHLTLRGRLQHSSLQIEPHHGPRLCDGGRRARHPRAG